MYAQRQVVELVFLRGSLRRLALLVLGAKVDVLVLLLRQGPLRAVPFGVQLGADALEDLAPLVEGLDSCQMLEQLLLLDLCHVSHWLLRGGVYPRGRGIGQNALGQLLVQLAIFEVSFFLPVRHR